MELDAIQASCYCALLKASDSDLRNSRTTVELTELVNHTFYYEGDSYVS